jgi:hypothetical protein
MIKKIIVSRFVNENNKYNYDFYIGNKFEISKSDGVSVKEIIIPKKYINEILDYFDNYRIPDKLFKKQMIKNIEYNGFSELGSISYNIKGNIARTILYAPKFYIGKTAEGLDDKLELICLNDLYKNNITHVTIDHRFENNKSRMTNHFSDLRKNKLLSKLNGNHVSLIKINKYIKILETLKLEK